MGKCSNIYKACSVRKSSNIKSSVILAQIQQLKHWHKVWNLFMVNNKDIRTSDLMHLLLLWTFSPIFNFEQAFADWVVCRHQPSLCLPVSNQLWTIFTSCFSIFTTNFEQGNTGSYFHTSIHRRSQQNMLQLNVNRKKTAGFFQIYLQHCLPLWYPHNFRMIHLYTRHMSP